MSNAGRTRDPTDTMEMDWSPSPQASRQHHTTSLNLESRGENERGRAGNTWRRDLEADVTETGYTWRRLERLAHERSAWTSHVWRPVLQKGRRRLWLMDWLISTAIVKRIRMLKILKLFYVLVGYSLRPIAPLSLSLSLARQVQFSKSPLLQWMI